MYKILIVDDEKKEREGIALLIRRYKLALDVTLVENGEEALKRMEHATYDILLTDIKMPYMDGIQLIREVKKRGMNPVCIIYSAYGEFEYAQNAIALGVMEYLLKPIKLEDFQKLFDKVIEICDTREKANQEKAKIRLVQEEAAYQKASWDMLTYLESEEYHTTGHYSSWKDTLEEEIKPFLEFGAEVCIPVVISCYSNIFSSKWDDYQKKIEDQFGDNTIIINNIDNQIIALLVRKKGEYRYSDIKKRCENLLEQSQRQYQVDALIILGKETDGLKELREEYTEIKDQLDYQFFISKSMLLIRDESFFLKKEHDMISLYFERIFNCAKMSDVNGIKKELEKVFEYLAKQTGFSSIYIKYTFTDAIKKISEYTKTKLDLLPYIEAAYQAKTLEEVNELMNGFLEDMKSERGKEVKENRIVHMAKEIVYEKYGENDLNVSSIAESLQVSGAYLSSLYKIETGQNLVKFITQYRVEKSKELLRQTNMKVSDVAGKVGYLNVSYYISIFRTHEGCSPIQYREGQQKNE